MPKSLNPKKTPRHWLFAAGAIVTLGVFALGFLQQLFTAPQAFPSDEIIEIPQGQTLAEVAQHLEKNALVKHARAFQWTVMFLQDERSAVAGSYVFKKPLNTFALAERITEGNFGLEPRSVTFPEGMTIAQMARRLENRLPNFSTEKFIRLADNREGYLFPDTYEFFPEVSAAEVIERMNKNFQEKTAEIRARVTIKSDRQFQQIVTMASIIEREASSTANRRQISGILWKRLRNDMPLQVDAPFAYFTNKNTFELTRKDLQVDSPYNTYRYKGLPPTPIASPGLNALRAAANPTSSPYLYYLSDRDGNVYYSETLEAHQQKKERYLPRSSSQA